MPTITRSSFVIAVPDLKASAAFYRDVLGFIVRTVSDPGWLFFTCGDCTIMAGEWRDAMQPSKIGDHPSFAYLHLAHIYAHYPTGVATGAPSCQTRPTDAPGPRN